MLLFTTPKTESCTQTLVRVSSFLPFRPFCSSCPSIHTTISNDVRGSELQTLDARQSISPGTVPGIRILCRIFSASNLTRRTPNIYPIRALRELYLGACARRMLGDLSGPQFSAMIALFGTLSVSDPPCQFKSPLAQDMDKREPRAWWGFILQMVRDKKRVTGILKECDLYWLMRARVSEASLIDLNVYAGDGGEFRIFLAKTRF